MLFGDLNAKHSSWNCDTNNKAGNELFAIQQSNDFLIHHTADHTHFPHSGQSPSTIDILLSNVNLAIDFFTHQDQMSSDHAPTICCTHGTTARTMNERFDYHRANWRIYRQLIESDTNSLTVPSTHAEIDAAIDSFSNIVMNAQRNSVPTIAFNNKPQISDFTKQLIQFKNILNRQMQRTTDSDAKRSMKSTINRLQREVNDLVRSDFNDFWDKKLRDIPKGGKKLWQLSKEFKGKSDSNATKITISSSQSTSDTDRANLLANIFEKAHNTISSFTHSNDRMVRQTINSFNVFSNMRCVAPNVSTREISDIIRTIRPFKAPGPDAIRNIVLKNMPSSAIDWLTKVFNKCLELCYWPSSFKIAKVIPILKSGKSPTDARSYRPISLLNSFGKILERIIYTRLTNIIEEKNLLPSVQFGFRKGHSTIHQAMRVKKFITKNKLNKKSTGMILLDIEKAFDSVWHDGLIFKLTKMNLPTYLVRIINSFIRNRHFVVHVNGGTSRKVAIPAGLAQGTCISPILYALFVSDMPDIEKIEKALYADDTTLYTAARSSNIIVKRLNSSLLILQDYFVKWKIKMNDGKTQAIIFPFNRRRVRTPTIPLRIEQRTIELSEYVNYLGVILDKRLLFNRHISNAINKTNKCFRALYPLMAAKSKLSTSNKLLIYTAVLRPIMSYGSPVWNSAATTHLNKLDVMQNKILKTIFRLPWRTPTSWLSTITGFSNFNSYIITLNSKFSSSCTISNFDLIREIEMM